MNSYSENRTQCLGVSIRILDWRAHTVLAAAAIALILSTPIITSLSLAIAEQSSPVVAVAYQDGKITGVYETTIQIDHRTFSLAPEVVILDRHGDPLAERDIRVDLEVKYHLLKGTTDKIDQIIVFLPE